MRFIITILAGLLLAGPVLALENTSKRGHVLRSSDAHTADLRTQFVNNGDACGAYIYWDATVDGASAAVTVTIEIVELGGGATVAMNSFTETINAVEEKVLQIGTATVAAEGVDEIMTRTLPYRFNVFLDHADADAITYSASIQFLKHCTGAANLTDTITFIANGESINNNTDGRFDFTRDEQGTVSFTSSDADDVANLQIFPGGASILTLGASATTTVSVLADDAFTVATDDGTITMDGTLVSTGTGTFGWTIQASADQACTTTCTTPCVFGWDTSGTQSTIVACAGATADECLCAGGS